MKIITFLITAILIGFSAINVPAQFNIKIPKINKPKTEQPKTDGDSSGTTNPNPNRNQSPKSGGSVGYMPQPLPTNTPVLLKNTLNIGIKSTNTYWKFPNQTFYTSWMPVIFFDLFFDNSETVRYTAEWLNPDGSLWFSQPVDGTQTRYDSALFDTKASIATGTFGLRLLNSKTKEVVFQGKFKVNRQQLNPGEPRYKNLAAFSVENDWSLPIGYVGFDEHTTWDKDPTPTVYMWFKGDLQKEDFEARLFYNNQQITSTDDGGAITNGSSLGSEERNSDNCAQQPEVCHYLLWGFSWKNFIVESFDPATHNYAYRRENPNAVYTKDKPGEYTVKIFYKGQQVRETKFTIQPNGWLAANAFATQLPMDRLKIVVPIKIMGTLDKYNAAAWKADAFYGNPLPGFFAP